MLFWRKPSNPHPFSFANIGMRQVQSYASFTLCFLNHKQLAGSTGVGAAHVTVG